MRLSQLEIGEEFVYDGQVYTHDLSGRSGSGKVAVINLETGKPCLLSADATVSLKVYEIPPDTSDSFDDVDLIIGRKLRPDEVMGDAEKRGGDEEEELE